MALNGKYISLKSLGAKRVKFIGNLKFCVSLNNRGFKDLKTIFIS